MAKTFIGAKLRRLRAEQSISQAALARTLDLSTSYVNQLENDQRPATVPVLMKLTSSYDVDLNYFAGHSDARLVADLSQLFHEFPELGVTGQAEIDELVARMPTVARALLTLSRQSIRTDSEATAFEQVRDFFYDRDNHIAELDDAAEALFADANLSAGRLDQQLASLLRERSGIHVSVTTPASGSLRRVFRPEERQLEISHTLTPGQRAFEIATQIAFLDHAETINTLVAQADSLSPDAIPVARVGLANYFAGALLLPYRTFLHRAEATGYDIDVLSREFDVSFETVCHRLSTLQRSGQRGVPFFFVRSDRAGNISKRQSATAFHFSRVGGSCPLWVIHDAFATPGRLLRQVAQMPDGRTYLWLARTTSPADSGLVAPAKSFAIGLGCDIVHADKLVYARGLDLTDASIAVPIGPGCKTCDRTDCSQRAFPQLRRPIVASENFRSTLPYLQDESAASAGH